MLQDDRAQMNEIFIPHHPKIGGKQLKDLKFPKDAIIGLIVRDGSIIVPQGNDLILAGDRVLIFAMTTVIKDATSYLTKVAGKEDFE